MRKKGTLAARKDDTLNKEYGKIGISAVEAAARYERSEKSRAAQSKSKSADKSSFRGTSPRR